MSRFSGVGMQYIAFAKDEPQLYRLLFLNGDGGISDAVKELGATVREPLTRIYSLTAEEADLFFRDMWLVVHSIATLTVSGDCGYGEKEISGILTGFSVAVCKAIKEVPGFVSGTFDRNQSVCRTRLGKIRHLTGFHSDSKNPPSPATEERRIFAFSDTRRSNIFHNKRLKFIPVKIAVLISQLFAVVICKALCRDQLVTPALIIHPYNKPRNDCHRVIQITAKLKPL